MHARSFPGRDAAEFADVSPRAAELHRRHYRWHYHSIACLFPHTDGIDPSGWNYLISDCTIDAGDDNIAIKPIQRAESGK